MMTLYLVTRRYMISPHLKHNNPSSVSTHTQTRLRKPDESRHEHALYLLTLPLCKLQSFLYHVYLKHMPGHSIYL
jgi:hypothetical protein